MKRILTISVFTISFVSAYSQNPPVQPPPPTPVEEVFQKVEEMPRFPGCENQSEKKRKTCADKLMLSFMFKNIRYPKEASRDSTEGTVVAQFIVEKDGTLTEKKIVRKVGSGCDEEVIRVIDMMPLWEPGRQSGKPVRVRYTLPVKFKLN